MAKGYWTFATPTGPVMVKLTEVDVIAPALGVEPEGTVTRIVVGPQAYYSAEDTATVQQAFSEAVQGGEE